MSERKWGKWRINAKKVNPLRGRRLSLQAERADGITNESSGGFWEVWRGHHRWGVVRYRLLKKYDDDPSFGPFQVRSLEELL